MTDKRFIALLVFFVILFVGASLYQLEKDRIAFQASQVCR